LRGTLEKGREHGRAEVSHAFRPSFDRPQPFCDSLQQLIAHVPAATVIDRAEAVNVEYDDMDFVMREIIGAHSAREAFTP
jgi:hypothetical protein